MKENEKERIEALTDQLYKKLMDSAVKSRLLRPVGENRNRGKEAPDNRTLAEIQQSLLPRAYELRAEICEQTKNGMYFVKKRDVKELSEAAQEGKMAFEKLIKLGLELEYLQEFLASSGQELFELLYVAALFPIIIGDYDLAEKNIKELLPLPHNNDLRIHYKWSLGGIEDAITELGKLMQDVAIEEDPQNFEAYEAFFYRTLKVAETLYTYLEKYETTNKRFMDNSEYRGQGFQDKLRRIKEFIYVRIQPNVIQTRMDILLIKSLHK